MSNIKFYKEQNLPLEMHKVRIVQKLNLLPIEERLSAIKEAGNNTFLLRNKDVYLEKESIFAVFSKALKIKGFF